MRRLCFAIDLVEDEDLIACYDWFHQPEQARATVTASLLDGGIRELEIYRVTNRLFMVMDVNDDFDLLTKAAMDANNPEVALWESEMDRFQRPIGTGPKWSFMEPIYSLRQTAEFLEAKRQGADGLPAR
jgi:L-rhamnose mutarotase